MSAQSIEAVEAERMYDNAQRDRKRISAMRTETAEILASACTQAIYARGVIPKERLREKLIELLEAEL